jgi:predicted Zn-dependent peptidase
MISVYIYNSNYKDNYPFGLYYGAEHSTKIDYNLIVKKWKTEKKTGTGACTQI